MVNLWGMRSKWLNMHKNVRQHSHYLPNSFNMGMSCAPCVFFILPFKVKRLIQYLKPCHSSVYWDVLCIPKQGMALRSLWVCVAIWDYLNFNQVPTRPVAFESRAVFHRSFQLYSVSKFVVMNIVNIRVNNHIGGSSKYAKWLYVRWVWTQARWDWTEHWKTRYTHTVSKFQLSVFLMLNLTSPGSNLTSRKIIFCISCGEIS